MKVTLVPIIVWISIFNFISAIPVKYKDPKSENVFQISEIMREEPVEVVNFQKRDITALTLLFQSLNNSATISLAKTALQLSLTRDQVCNFVGSFIQTKGLESILESADQSGLALDLVLMILTHYETVDGLTNAIKYGKKNPSTSGGSCTTTSSGSTGLLGGLFNGISSIIGLGNSGSSTSCTNPKSGTSSASPSATNKDNSSSTTSVPSATTVPSTNSGSGGGIIGNIIGGIGSIFGWNVDDSSPSSTPTATNTAISTTSKTSVAFSTPFAATTSATGKPFTLVSSTSVAQNTQSTGVSTSSRSISSIAIPSGTKTRSATVTSSSTTTAPGSSGDLLTGIANGIGGLISGIFGREDLAEIAEKEGLIGVMKREDVNETELMHQLFKRALDENLTLLQKRDLLSIIYSQIIAIIGTDSNIEEIFESLAKSGLAINVVYNALVDSGFYVFDVQLYTYLVNNGYISLTSVVNAALSSGLVTHIISDFVANSAYLKLVVNFIIAIFTGGVNVIGLFAVIF